ncbi:transcriptional regulator [Nocardia nova SH22a]|uniref:Transcriptional regulator n=1 Tax=Nocardia nova SH22a TaxID=1415166 RepID=W5TER9_9NOCA|nr:helix-turn-helix domain-containing protein [Nocardia nova]AHH17659.1 transcriptional regulator [Nocardia nova SH22a]
MPSVSAHPGIRPARPEIASAWLRSRLNGLDENVKPRYDPDAIVDSGLTRAARPVLERATAELEGTSVTLLLADRSARVVDIQCADRTTLRGVADLGVVPGIRLAEDEVGANAVGTPIETRQGLLVEGAEHFMAAFQGFTCYGHPIVNPVTRRLEGVLDISGRAGDDHRLFPPFARRVVRDIEDRLHLDASQSQRQLLNAFQTAATRRKRAVVAVGHGLVLATPAALDLLEPADHAALRMCVEGTRFAGEATHRLTLVSGRTVRLRCVPVDDDRGMLVDIIPEQDIRRGTRPAARSLGWPLLVVGELGSGRTTAAREAAGADAAEIDATEIVRLGEQTWAADTERVLGSAGPAAVVENVQLLSEQMTTLLARYLRDAQRQVVLTSTPGDHLDGVHAPLAVLCNGRQELLPLRRRRHEIPQLAQHLLSDVRPGGRTRLTAETLRILAEQPWPGNLAELQRVIAAVAELRSAGDIIPSDLPASHRDRHAPASPFRQAEREIIVAALEAAGGNRLQAARALGVSRSTLYNRLRALHID